MDDKNRSVAGLNRQTGYATVLKLYIHNSLYIHNYYTKNATRVTFLTFINLPFTDSVVVFKYRPCS